MAAAQWPQPLEPSLLLLRLQVELSSADAEETGGLAFVAPGEVEDPFDVFLFDVVEAELVGGGSQGWSLIPCRVLQTALTDGRSG